MRRAATSLLVLSAFATGGAGMGLQSVLLAYAGLACGHSASAAYGPGVFAAGWCAGAWFAGRLRGRSARAFAALAFAAPAVAAAAAWWLRSADEAPMNSALAFLALGLAAIPQGMFLTLQCREVSRGHGAPKLTAVYVANLLGALAGAWGIGLATVAVAGRTGALLAANGVVVLGAVLGLVGANSVRESATSEDSAPALALSLKHAAPIAAVAALWMFALEWLCLRIAVLWVGSQVGELTRIVACSLLALALGAALLPRWVARDARGVVSVLTLAALASTWPLWCSPALEWSARTVAPALRSSEWLAPISDVAISFVLVAPALAPLGAVVPVLHRASSGESGARLGNLLLFEALGALAAGPLLHIGLVPAVGVGAALAWLPLLASLAALALLARRELLPRLALLGAISLGATLVAHRASPPALSSPKLTDPALNLRAFAEDEHFAVSVVDDGVNGERTLLTDTFRAAGDGREYAYMRVLGHLPVLAHPRPARAAVVALGTGTTVGAVALHREVEALDVLELSPKVVEFAPWFEAVNRGALTPDPTRRRADGSARVQVRIGDGRRLLATDEARYDVITIEPLLPDSPFGVYLYTPGFYAVVKRALAPGGVFAQWVPPHAMPPEVCSSVVDAFARSFAWSGAWLAGTQLVLLGADAAPEFSSQRFAELDEELRRALAEVGCESPAAVRARWISDLANWPAGPRALSDDDPWIVWRDRRADPPTLEWLPRNLELATAGGAPPPWTSDGVGDARRALLGALREARIASAWSEARRRAGARDEPDALELAKTAFGAEFARARAEPEVAQFLSEAEFLDALRRGVAALAQGDARAALRDCVRAAELRSERADVHLYVAACLTQLGEQAAAQAALARAERGCPRWRETSVGQRALRLGLGAGGPGAR